MCINPSQVWVQREGEWTKQAVACRQCWRCRENRVSDYVARAMAEAAYAQQVATITLTYAPRDDLADKLLSPKHFQLFIKLLRRAGHKVRYLVAGEYGDLRARAHFHAILFFSDLLPLHGHDGERRINVAPQGAVEPVMVVPMVPRYKHDYPDWADQSYAPFCREIPQERMVHIREWPHGHVQVDWSASEAAIRYVCKYLLADDKNNAWFSLSKKPALGAAFFAEKAAKAKEWGVMPSTFNYLPPGGDRERPYLMTGASRRDYLAAIDPDPAERPRWSEWVQKTYDKHEKERLAKDSEAFWSADGGARMVAAMRRLQGLAQSQRERQWAEYWRGVDEALAEGHDLVLNMGEWKRKEPTDGTEKK